MALLPLRYSEMTSPPHLLFSSSGQKDKAKNNFDGSAEEGEIPPSPMSFGTELGEPKTCPFAVFIDR